MDCLREREIFDRCLELAPEVRAEFVLNACSGNPALSGRVMSLLEAYQQVEKESFPPALDRAEYEIPNRIGPYTVLGVLGEGGMGTVYEAEQTEPLPRKVALKVVKLGMDTREVVARLELERQALAVMDHANIAKVLDAGVTPFGRPYFVMELVRGMPLHEYCADQNLTTRERLELFKVLCQAVQHAHHKGIIHRDLKPTNVLVAEQDGKPVPKVIDFGVAKAIGGRLTRETLVTLHGQAVGTPAYMSPEQAGVSGLDVDTRSDIYSLGVMLYELLSGALPVDPEAVGVPEFLAQLARWETDPPVPSAKLDSRGAHGRGALARKLLSELESLRQELKGDLDWIVMKAMEKDRSRRYETASEMALEIERYLHHEPVRARPPTPGYRLRKFVRRHKTSVSAGAVAMVALLLGMAGTGIGLMRATQAETAARRDARRAQQAEEHANQRLSDSLAAQARANLRSGSPGRRYRTLELLGQAAALDPGSHLRNEAIAAMILADLAPAAEWNLPGDNSRTCVEFDRGLQRFMLGFVDGRIEIHGASGGLILTLPGEGHIPRFGRFSPDGRLLAVKYHQGGESDRPAFRVWELASGSAVLSSDQAVSGRSVDLDLGGQRIAYATPEPRLFVRDIASGRQRLAIRLDSPPAMIRFRPDGRALALANGRGQIEIRDLSGRVLRRFHSAAPASCLDWSGDGLYLGAGFQDYAASIWHVADGRQTASLRGHQAEVVEVLFHPRAPVVATYSWDETSRFWDVMTGRQLLVTNVWIKGFSWDGRHASFITSGTAGTLEVLNDDYFRTLYGHVGKSPFCLHLSEDSRWIGSGGPDGTLLWEADTGRRVGTLPGREIRDVIFSAGAGGLFTCGAEGFVQWNPGGGGSSLADLRPHRLSSRPCRAAGVDASGRVKAVDEGGRTKIVAVGHSPARYIEGFRGMTGLEVSPGGEWIACGNWRGAQTLVWDIRSGQEVASLLPGTQSVNVRFSPDGNWLATGSSRDYRIWRVGSWTEVLRLDRPKRFSQLPGIMDFSGDGKLLAVLIDQSAIRIVQVTAGDEVAELRLTEPQAVVEIRFSNDGRRLLAATSTNRILIWELDKIRRRLAALHLDGGLDSAWPVKEGGSLATQVVAPPASTRGQN